MEILEAYCEEMGEVMDIYDAQNAYFDLPDSRRKRFTFRCSDEECRRQKNPLVSGVNYHRLSEETDKYRQPHFRAPTANEHLDSCIWNEVDAQPSGTGTSPDESSPRLERAKKTNVIDVFRPGRSDVLKSPGNTCIATTAQPEGNVSSADNAATEGKPARTGYSSTSRLERFIDCWLQFQGDQLKQHEVVIDGATLTYRQAVTNPAWIKEEHNGHRILYGAVRISYWPPAKPTRVYLNFRDQCDQFPENNGDKSLTIDLPLSRINSHRGSAVMLNKLSQAQQADHYLKVYCWGVIEENEERPGYLVEIASLSNLVLKPVKKKSAPTR